MGVPVARRQLGQLARMTQQHYRSERVSREEVDQKAPFVARLDHLLLAKREMAARGAGADIARHQDRGRHAAGRRHVERALQASCKARVQ